MTAATGRAAVVQARAAALRERLLAQVTAYPGLTAYEIARALGLARSAWGTASTVSDGPVRRHLGKLAGERLIHPRTEFRAQQGREVTVWHPGAGDEP